MTIEPIDTSTLGPIRLDMNSDRIRAKVVRDALLEISRVAKAHESTAVYSAINVLGGEASDALLARLGRLLK